ncbi:MAG: class I SAM-dependent methyltransferase [Bacillota bacterium]|nr:class I SAM-dependent methyltransferase [Bacillota bacterium]MDW7684543.1 class I SAM-dependent methyltransferase [Bacillota bacterium]
MFYETLAVYYDEIFPAEPTKISFLDKQFKMNGAVRILDSACGTGTYTLELARLGYETWGIDLEANMVEAARQKANRQNLNACFQVSDMRRADKLGKTFDGLFCIGNSLAHLLHEKDLAQALSAMYHALGDGGIAVIQIVNFDRIMALGDTELPLIERENLRFIRTYRPRSEHSLIFDSVLEVKTEERVISRLQNSVKLRPIRKRDLEKYLLAAGFSEIRTFGNFKEEPYRDDSAATVMVAAK